MLLVPGEIANLIREAAFDAVEKVFAAMAQTTPIISRHSRSIGHEDALYGLRVLIARD